MCGTGPATMAKGNGSTDTDVAVDDELIFYRHNQPRAKSYRGLRWCKRRLTA